MTERYANETGSKADAGKPPLDLIPWESVLGAARVFAFGAKKYSPYNWRGLSKSRLMAATFRHIIAWWMGEDLDSETGEPHLYHATCCVLMLASHHGIDDRPDHWMGDTERPFGGPPCPVEEYAQEDGPGITDWPDNVDRAGAASHATSTKAGVQRYRRLDKMPAAEHIDGALRRRYE